MTVYIKKWRRVALSRGTRHEEKAGEERWRHDDASRQTARLHIVFRVIKGVIAP